MKIIELKESLHGYTYPPPINLVIHDYEYGYYDGHGNLIFRTDSGEWGYHNMGHCSCNGPLDDLEVKVTYPTLDALVANCSQTLQKELAPHVKRARRFK